MNWLGREVRDFLLSTLGLEKLLLEFCLSRGACFCKMMKNIMIYF